MVEQPAGVVEQQLGVRLELVEDVVEVARHGARAGRLAGRLARRGARELMAQLEEVEVCGRELAKLLARRCRVHSWVWRLQVAAMVLAATCMVRILRKR